MADQYKDLIQETTILTTLRFAFIADAVAGAHTVTGIQTRDKLIAVLPVLLALAEAAPPLITYTPGVNLLGEFTISAANTIDNTGGTTLVDKVALVVYLAIPEELG